MAARNATPRARARSGRRRPNAYRPRDVVLRDGRRVTLRSIRPDDIGEIIQAFDRLSVRSRYMRFMQHKKQLNPAILARGTNPVPGSEFAFVATVPAHDGYDIVGAARYVPADAPATCEFAVTVADEWIGAGLASAVMRSLIRRARYDGYRVIEGLVLRENSAMLGLARRLGFRTQERADDRGVVVVRRELQPVGPGNAGHRRVKKAVRGAPANAR